MKNLLRAILNGFRFSFNKYLFIVILPGLVANPLFVMATSDAFAPWDAVKYREYPLGGPCRDNGRELQTNGHAYYGIDINSRVDINIDEDQLRSGFLQSFKKDDLSSDARMLDNRIKSLANAISQLDNAIRLSEKSIELFRKARKNNEAKEAFMDIMADIDKIMDALFDPLIEVWKSQLIKEGYNEGAAADSAEEMLNPVLEGPNVYLGYDWGQLEKLLRQEIQKAERGLEDLLGKTEIELEIQAHLIKKQGDRFPIYLPGYNKVETGPAAIYSKLHFGITRQEELELYAHYTDMAGKIGKTKNFSEAILNSFKAEFQMYSSEMQEMPLTAQQALTKAGKKIDTLVAWADTEKWGKWFESARNDLKGTEEGQKLIDELKNLESIFKDVKSDVSVLKSYSDLKGRLAGQDAEQAMNTILGILKDLHLNNEPSIAGVRALDATLWKDRLAEVKRFLAIVDSLSPNLKNLILSSNSPVKNLQESVEAISDVTDILNNLSSGFLGMLSKMLGYRPIYSVSDLPVPQGQMHKGFGEELGTSVDLQTIKQSRDEDDEVRVQYRFFKGEKPLGIEWSDRFLLRVFGWHDQVFASLSFVRQEGESEYTPTAAFSWIINKRFWPSANVSGLKGLEGVEWFSGFGISTMMLDFEEDQEVEVGFSGTISFINNRLLLGYGANLQSSTNRMFGFFALRLFAGSGFVSTKK